MTASRIQEISPFIVMEVLEKAVKLEKQGVHIIHLEVGEPDCDMPASGIRAPCQALEESKTHYTNLKPLPPKSSFFH